MQRINKVEKINGKLRNSRYCLNNVKNLQIKETKVDERNSRYFIIKSNEIPNIPISKFSYKWRIVFLTHTCVFLIADSRFLVFDGSLD